MNALSLIRLGDLPTCDTSPEAAAEAAECIRELEGVAQITDALDADAAGAVLNRAQKFSRGVEAARKTVKAPVVELGRVIDGLAAKLVAPVEHQAGRVQRLLGAYLAEQNRLRQEAEAKARAEEARRIAEAEQIKDQERATEAIRAAVQNTNAAIAAAATPRPAGVAVRKKVTITVTNPAALYAARPDLVELVPKLAAIKEALLANPKLPGVLMTTEDMATTTTARK
ncbi:MAG: hypothetical protein LDL56_01730 [Armatimonadetes bacterium]|nr:hypothetical protein [Armatimonadota bacterium]